MIMVKMWLVARRRRRKNWRNRHFFQRKQSYWKRPGLVVTGYQGKVRPTEVCRRGAGTAGTSSNLLSRRFSQVTDTSMSLKAGGTRCARAGGREIAARIELVNNGEQH